MGPAEIREVLDQSISHRIKSGDTVFHEGDAAERFFVLLDGYIRVMRITSEGEHVTVLHIPPGELFGIAKAFGRSQYPATAVAASESIALSWPMRLWSEFAKRFENFQASSNLVMGKRVQEMNDRIMELATQQVEQRVANALLRLIRQTGRKTETGIEVDFPITRQDLSELTGTTLHTVSRLLSAWEKRGIVESRRKRIMVSRPHELVILAENAALR
nr:Crp/Fnr family transcriptional regulator [Marivita sp. GX14005]